MMDEKIWYYAVDGEQKGPIDVAELNLLIAVSTIGPYTLVWREGMADWQPAAAALPDSEIPEGWERPATPPPPPPAREEHQPPSAAAPAREGAPTYEEWMATDHPTEFMDCVKTCFNKYAHFRGRARRPEYWYFVLFNFLVGIALNVVDGMVFGWANDVAVFNPLYSLAVLVPSIAVGARRLHDTGRSGWWQLIWFIPIVGWIILIIWLASRGESRQNQYGPA
ncbi:MAG: hypothetical protein CL534_14290 [Ahrensia sp.]|nr:hypothetical protein [Ahrensia sp.]